MENLLSTIKIQVNEKIYVKDPETSILGKKIIENITHHPIPAGKIISLKSVSSTQTL